MTQLQRFKEEIGPILGTIDTANKEAIDVYASIWNILGRHIETESAKTEPLEGGDLVSRKEIKDAFKSECILQDSRIHGLYNHIHSVISHVPNYSPQPAKPKTVPLFELTEKGHEIHPNTKNLQKPELYWRVDWDFDVKACLKHGILKQVGPERIELEFYEDKEGYIWANRIQRKDGKQFTEDQRQRMEDAINEA